MHRTGTRGCGCQTRMVANQGDASTTSSQGLPGVPRPSRSEGPWDSGNAGQYLLLGHRRCARRGGGNRQQQTAWCRATATCNAASQDEPAAEDEGEAALAVRFKRLSEATAKEAGARPVPVPFEDRRTARPGAPHRGERRGKPVRLTRTHKKVRRAIATSGAHESSGRGGSSRIPLEPKWQRRRVSA